MCEFHQRGVKDDSLRIPDLGNRLFHSPTLRFTNEKASGGDVRAHNDCVGARNQRQLLPKLVAAHVHRDWSYVIDRPCFKLTKNELTPSHQTPTSVIEK
jgi:hypothetical protein